MRIGRRLVAEGIGTALLLVIVVGSGIMAERLSQGNLGLALLANSIAIGGGLAALILALGSVSAQFNPVVTLAAAREHGLSWRDVPATLGAQVAGGIAGVALAHVMFGLPVITLSSQERSGPGQLVAEFVATFGLILVIRGCGSRDPARLAGAVGAYIAAACWFTSSTSFANPAVTMARALTDSFTGIRPADVPGFIVAQLLAAAAATLVVSWLFGSPSERSST